MLSAGCGTALAAPSRATLDVVLSQPLASFRPQQAIGGALDGHGEGETAAAYTSPNLRAMRAAGLGALTYRLRTELGVQAWHFDARGDWSEPSRSQGYWTGSGTPPKLAPGVSWGYELPRRGDTSDQAEDKGYSRIDDGSPETFWKSNPYLDSHFTHEREAHHPQWVMLDLGRPRAIDALAIAWGTPYAVRFKVQRYVGGPDAVALAPGHWRDFPHGSFRGRAGTQTLRLARAPLMTRFVRLLMSASSHTALPGARDVRDRLGYAIRELYLGTLGPAGALRDLLVHAASQSQTAVYTSSTDPWHRAVDLNRDYEQPSFQTVLHSGLTRGEPLLVPVPLLYGTPQDALAELRYLRALHVPLRGVELGEEPDGQLVSPEDYAALYVQFARSIRRSFPHLRLGGPAFASSLPDWAYWPNAHGDRSWTHRFISYLHAHRALGLLNFFSFEWYPFDDVCTAAGPQLARAASLLRATLELQHREGIPRAMPVYVTEYGYSAYAGEPEVDMAGALFDADTVGTLLTDGVSGAYLYGYEPNVPIREAHRCNTWGNLMLLREDAPGAPPAPVAAFWETQMLTRDWTLAGDRLHTLYAVRWQRGAGSHIAVHAYALRRPDGRLALLLVNLSPTRSYRVSIRVSGVRGCRCPPRAHRAVHLVAPAAHLAHRAVHLARRAVHLVAPEEWTLSAADYSWDAAEAAGAPGLDTPPLYRALRADEAEAGAAGRAGGGVLLAPYSITVLRSALG